MNEASYLGEVMKKYITSGLILSVLLVFGGCGSSDDSTTSTETITTGTAYYVDSAVSGVDYVCGSKNGVTDANGEFTFVVDQNCTFKLGEMVVKTIASANLVDKAKIVEDNVTVAALLQSLDVDGDAANGITIEPAVSRAMKDLNITKVPVDDNEIATLVSTLDQSITDSNISLTPVSTAEAETHLTQTQAEVTTELLANKIHYVAHITQEEHFVREVRFDEAMTQVTIKGIVDDNTSDEIRSFSLEGNKLQWSDGSYSIVKGKKNNYILIADYDENSSSKGFSYMFDTEDDATKFYSEKFPLDLILSTTNDVSLVAPIPYTQSITTPYVGKTMTMKAGAIGDFQVLATDDSISISLVDGVESISAVEMTRTLGVAVVLPSGETITMNIYQDYATGEERIIGGDSSYGSTDCTKKFSTQLPVTVTTDPDDYFVDKFNFTQEESSTCPEWLNIGWMVYEGEHTYVSTGDFLYYQITVDTIVTSSTGRVSHVAKYVNIQ